MIPASTRRGDLAWIHRGDFRVPLRFEIELNWRFPQKVVRHSPGIATK